MLQPVAYQVDANILSQPVPMAQYIWRVAATLRVLNASFGAKTTKMAAGIFFYTFPAVLFYFSATDSFYTDPDPAFFLHWT